MTPSHTTTPEDASRAERLGVATAPFCGLSDPSRLATLQHLSLGAQRVGDLTQQLTLARSTVRAHLACPRAGGVPADGPGLDLRAHVRSSFLDVLTVPPRRPGDQRVTREEATVGYGWAPAARRCPAGPPAPAEKADAGRIGVPAATAKARRNVHAGQHQARLAGAPRPRGEGSHRTVRGPELLLGGKVSWWTAKNPAGERPERAYRPRHP